MPSIFTLKFLSFDSHKNITLLRFKFWKFSPSSIFIVISTSSTTSKGDLVGIDDTKESQKFTIFWEIFDDEFLGMKIITNSKHFPTPQWIGKIQRTDNFEFSILFRQCNYFNNCTKQCSRCSLVSPTKVFSSTAQPTTSRWWSNNNHIYYPEKHLTKYY